MSRFRFHLAPLAAAVTLLVATTAAQAQPGSTPAPQAAPVEIQITAQPLSQALVVLARQAHLELMVQPALVEGRTAPAVQGRFTVREALNRLLAGSGLYAEVEGSSVVVRRLSPGPGAATLPQVTVTAQEERGATSEGTDSFAARAVSINKGDQALKDIPQSISVITHKQIEEQGITDLKQAANIATGTVGVTGVGQGMVLAARGFQIDNWQYDGVAIPRNMYSLGNWAAEGMAFYDRLEVLRGASGLLQGTGSPGGAVNLVRKRGQSEKTVTLTTRAGSWDRYGVQLDVGGPLNAEGTLRGRAVVDEARSHSFVDYVNDRSRSLYAALDYDISPDTTVGLGVSQLDSKGRPFIYGVPLAADSRDVGLSRSTFTGASWNRSNLKQTTVYADLNHRFNADWKLKVSALQMNETSNSTHQRMHGTVAPDGSGMTYADWITHFDSDKVGLDAFVNGSFDALGLRHEVTLGADYSKYKSDDKYTRNFTSGGNLFDIDHNRPKPTEESLLAAGGRQSVSSYDVRQKGIYASWRAQLTEPLTAIVGARVAWYDLFYKASLFDTREAMHTSGEVVPYFGLVYALSPQWSAYGSYTSVFEPQSARTAAGKVLEPVIGTNYELGIKGELMDKRVNTSLAVFRYDHKNRAVNDMASGYACDGWYCSTASGKVRSQGLEAEVSGEVLRNLQLIAGYTFNTTKFLSDPDNQGKVFSTWTPKHMLRVWASYRHTGDWNRLTTSAGFTTQSHTLDYDRANDIPGFTTWNMRFAYQATPEVNIAMNLNNIFDKRYIVPGYTGYTGANYGDPRNVMFTVKYTPRF